MRAREESVLLMYFITTCRKKRNKTHQKDTMKDSTVLWNVNLFETIRDSDTGALLVEAMEFAYRHQETLAKIEADLDAHGLEKTEARRDREYARRVSEAVSGQGAQENHKT